MSKRHGIALALSDSDMFNVLESGVEVVQPVQTPPCASA